MPDVPDDDLEEIVDLSGLSIPEPVEMTRVFTDPLAPGRKITLTLRAVADGFFTDRIKKTVGVYVRDFITGRPDPQRPGRTLPPAPLLLTASRGLPMPAEEMFGFIAALQTLQVGAKRDVHWWGEVAVKMPNAFADMSAFASEILARANGLWQDEPDADTAQGEGEGADGPND